MATATTEILGDIHRQLAETYRRLVSPREEPVYDKEGDIRMIEGVPVTRTVYPTAAELAAANAFLKQNNITAVAEEGDDLSDLRKQLADRRRRKPVVINDDDGADRIFQ